MSKKSFIVVSIFFVYLFFLIALMPASVVIKRIPLANNIQLGQVSGTIWHSQLSAVKIDDIVIEKLEARLALLSLLSFQPKIELNFGDALLSGPEGQASISGLLSNLAVSDAKLSLLANTIAQKLALPIPVQAHDYLKLDVKQFVMATNGGCQQLSGDIHWSNAAITALDEKVALGALHATLSCQQGNVAISLDEKNDLGLSFTAIVDPRGNVSGDGYLTPNNQMPQAIRQVIPFLGRADNQGRYRLNF